MCVGVYSTVHIVLVAVGYTRTSFRQPSELSLIGEFLTDFHLFLQLLCVRTNLRTSWLIHLIVPFDRANCNHRAEVYVHGCRLLSKGQMGKKKDLDSLPASYFLVLAQGISDHFLVIIQAVQLIHSALTEPIETGKLSRVCMVPNSANWPILT